jgi:tetratricopeptide (TPR) repeat protein
VYRNTRNYQTALIHYQQAFDIFKKNEDEKNIANLMERLGDLARDQEDLSGALEAFSRAKEICQNQNDELGLAHFNEKLALVYRSHGQLETAIQSFEEASTYYERHRVADRLAFVLTGLGELKYKIGQPQEALDYLGRALKIYRNLGARGPAELVAAEINGIEASLKDEKV